MPCFVNGKPIVEGQIPYSPPYWDDLRVAMTAAVGVGAQSPPFLQFQDDGFGSTGVFAYLFQPNVDRDLFFWAQMPHRWEEGVSIRPHIHWCTMGGAFGNVNWQFEYTVARITVPFPATTIDNLVGSASFVALEHQMNSFQPITMTNNLISTMLGCRISRLGSTDSYADPAALLEFDFHFTLDTPGSRQENIK
jgi:hypothetical protein